MSSFSPTQGFSLIDSFWRRIYARCPHDGAAISTQLYRTPEGYLLVLACSHCGRKVQVTRYSDPKRESFRKWTLEEREELADACARGLAIHCPVCEARLHCHGRGGSLLIIECPRCGNVHECFNPVPQMAPA